MKSGGRARSAQQAETPAQRDQDATIFSQILRRLLRCAPGARGAVLVDFEGETVDYAGKLEPFELRIAAAHWQIVLAELQSSGHGGARQIVVRTDKRGYIVRRIHGTYALVLVLHPRAAFAVSERALNEADALLCAEAGWPLPNTAFWFGLDVEASESDSKKPARICVGGVWYEVEIIGWVVGLSPRERGYRVRLSCGVEVTVIRESGGRWFANEYIEMLI